MSEVTTPDEVAPAQMVDLYRISPVSPAGLPSELLALSVFLNWGYLPDHKTGELKKCPVNLAGYAKGYADRQIHKTLDEAVKAQSEKSGYGVGISLLEKGLSVQSSDTDKTAWLWILDLDGFAELGGSEIDEEVRTICKRISSYEALSVSTTGAQIFFISDKPPTTRPKIKFSPSKFSERYPGINKYKNRAIEIFSKGRFIALTGILLFNGDPRPLRFIPSSEVDAILNWIDRLALDGGGEGWGAAQSRTENNIGEDNVSTGHYYAKLMPDSLKIVLRYVDHENEEEWFNTANVLARVYGEDGRSYFVDYSRGDYAGAKYARFDLTEVNAKFDRALDELCSRQNGYGIKHLIDIATAHKDWPKNVGLEYEDVFDNMFSPKDSASPIFLNIGAAPLLGDKSAVNDVQLNLESLDDQTGEKSKAQAVTDPAVVDLNNHWFVSVENGKTRIFRETMNVELEIRILEAFSTHDFKTLYANRTVLIKAQGGRTQSIGLADHWMKSPQRRQYVGGLALLPGSNAPNGVYNLWMGWGIEPIAGNAKPALRHLFFVICRNNKKAYQYLIRWMARAVQRPAEPAEVAVVMRGGRGTGKGTACRWLFTIFGAHGMHILQSKHLTGNFNAHLRTACFLFADEAFYAGDKSGEAVLKGLVTEEEIVIERKGVDAYTARNRLKIMMASNSDWVVPAGFDERRFFVLDVSDARKQDHSYFNELKAHMDSGGLSALLHYLKNLDISKFNIRSVPNTAGLDQQKLLSLPPFMAWLYECLYSGTLTGDADDWKTEVSRSSVTSNFELYVQKRRFSYVNTGRDAVGKGLKKVFPTLGEVKRRTHFAGRRERSWIVPPLDEARGQFEAVLALGNVDWPNEDDDET